MGAPKQRRFGYSGKQGGETLCLRKCERNKDIPYSRTHRCCFDDGFLENLSLFEVTTITMVEYYVFFKKDRVQKAKKNRINDSVGLNRCVHWV